MTQVVQSTDRLIPRHERGAALVIGLILLLVLTILAVSGVVTSTLELRQVGNQQQQESAFQAADTAIERAMSSAVLSTSAATVVARQPVDPVNDPNGPEFEFNVHYTGEAPLLGGGSSLTSGLRAYHFEVAASGYGPAGAVSDHQQGFYIVGPGGGGGF